MRSACRFNRALVRLPGRSVVKGLRAGVGEDPDYEGVAAAHSAYVRALETAGIDVVVLPALEAFPDSVFVEDVALVFSGAAILLRPGAPSRAGEVAMIEGVLREQFDRVMEIPAGGHADGGDILTMRDEVMIGLSSRTDRNGAESLVRLLDQMGLRARIVQTPAGILHFKSDCGLLDDDTIMTTARLAATGVFDGLDVIVAPQGEEAAANVLRVNDSLLIGEDFPRTIELLDRRGLSLTPLPTREIEKIDAGLSCMSLRWLAG